MLLSCRAANKSSSTWPIQSPAYCCHVRCSWTCLEQPVCSQELSLRQAGVTHDCCARRRKLTPLQQHYCFKMLPSTLHTSTVPRMLRFFTMSKNTFMRRCIEVYPEEDRRSSEGRWENTGGRVQVSISGRNSGISGGVWSTFAKVDTATQNDVRISFEGAKAACEQQAGSTAASSFAPAAARSGCLGRSLHILNTLT
jgi:hypothetical protein